MDKHYVLGVHITDRVKRAGSVQDAFTQHGDVIRTRLGLHETSSNVCSPNGLIILEIVDDDAACDALAKDLTAIEGVEVQKMVFDHP